MIAFTLLCLNCWLIPVKFAFPFLDFFVRSRAKRLVVFLKSFRPDIIILQEVWSPANFITYIINFLCFGAILGRSVVQRELEKRYAFITRPVGGKWWDLTRFLDSGLIIATNYPVHYVDFAPHSGSIKDDRLANKGTLAAAMTIGKQPAIVVTTHLAATGPGTIRQAQLEHLLAFISVFRSNAELRTGLIFSKIILGGDFNINGFDKDSYVSLNRRLSELGLVDISRDANAEGIHEDVDLERGEFPLYPSSDGCGDKLQRLDYLFAAGVSGTVTLTSGWKAPIDLVAKMHGKNLNELHIRRLRKRADNQRRREGITDHAGLLADLRFLDDDQAKTWKEELLSSS